MVMYLLNVWISTFPCRTVLYKWWWWLLWYLYLFTLTCLSFFVYWDLLNPNQLLNWIELNIRVYVYMYIDMHIYIHIYIYAYIYRHAAQHNVQNQKSVFIGVHFCPFNFQMRFLNGKVMPDDLRHIAADHIVFFLAFNKRNLPLQY